MSFYCSSLITIKHEDTLKIETLYNLFTEWLKDENFEANDYCYSSNVIAKQSGIETTEYYSGIIDRMEVNGNQIDIGIQSKDLSEVLLFKRVLDKYLNDAQFFYESVVYEEVNLTNKPDLTGTYHIEIYEDLYEELDMEYDAFGLEDMTGWVTPEITVITILQTLLETKQKKLETLLEMLKDSDYYDYVEINKWEFCAPEDL